jgi:transcriptional regulator with XRE-family HTH domain
MTGGQCRMARAALAWNAQELATKAGVGLNTVNRFESGECRPRGVTLEALRGALEAAGVFNCCGVIITTNHKTDGIYLPADDRRHFVAWSDREKKDFPKTYWDRLWDWYEKGGYAHVETYLSNRGEAMDVADLASRLEDNSAGTK